MRVRLPLYAFLACVLTFLASLYLTWVGAVRPAPGLGLGGVQGTLDVFSGDFASSDGWGAFGQVGALCGLAVFAGAGVSLLRPHLIRHWPLGSCAGALLFFAVLNAAELRGLGRFRAAFEHLHVQLGAGAYLGIASALIACIAAAVVRREEFTRRPSVTAVLAVAFTLGLLAAFLLPWLHVHVPRVGQRSATGYEIVSYGHETAVFIAAIACFGLPFWRSGSPPGRRVAAAMGAAVLTAADLSLLGTHVHWPYEAWLKLGCSVGLVLLALLTRPLRISLPSVADAAVVLAASLLIVSLFLPWQRFCSVGVCSTRSGWTQFESAAAGGLAVVLVLLLFGFHRLVFELAAGAAVYVTATGFELTRFAKLGYGAPLGFAGAALLLVAGARRVWRAPADWKRLLVRVGPLATCLAFLAIPVAALVSSPPSSFVLNSPWRVFWLEVAAVLIALRLLVRWLSEPRDDDELVFLPGLLLAVTALDLLVIRNQISWEGWASVVLCAVLVAFGWIEQNGGLERLRVPDEIWRIDRLPS